MQQTNQLALHKILTIILASVSAKQVQTATVSTFFLAFSSIKAFAFIAK